MVDYIRLGKGPKKISVLCFKVHLYLSLNPRQKTQCTVQLTGFVQTTVLLHNACWSRTYRSLPLDNKACFTPMRFLLLFVDCCFSYDYRTLKDAHPQLRDIFFSICPLAASGLLWGYLWMVSASCFFSLPAGRDVPFISPLSPYSASLALVGSLLYVRQSSTRVPDLRVFGFGCRALARLHPLPTFALTGNTFSHYIECCSLMCTTHFEQVLCCFSCFHHT